MSNSYFCIITFDWSNNSFINLRCVTKAVFIYQSIGSSIFVMKKILIIFGTCTCQ